MKKWLVAGLVLFTLAACGSPRSTSQAVASCYQGITTANDLATTALTQGQISIEDACHVSVWGKMGRIGCDQGLQYWVQGDPQTAQEHLDSALLAVNGLTEEARTVSEHICNEELK